MRSRAHITHGRLGGFLHYVAEFARGVQLSVAFHHGGLSGENRTAHFGPSEARSCAHFVLLVELEVTNLAGPKCLTVSRVMTTFDRYQRGLLS